MTTYEMKPIKTGTRQRKDHNTFAEVITSFSISDVLQGSELWTAPADGAEVKKGDQWLFVTKKNGAATPGGWVAYIHKGVAICNNFKEITEEVPQEPPAGDIVPYEFTLTEPSGRKSLYQFVRFVE